LTDFFEYNRKKKESAKLDKNGDITHTTHKVVKSSEGKMDASIDAQSFNSEILEKSDISDKEKMPEINVK